MVTTLSCFYRMVQKSGTSDLFSNQIKIKSNIFDNTKKQDKQTDEKEKITTKCMQKNSKTTC